MRCLVSILIALLAAYPALAGEVSIVHASFRQLAPGEWQVDVTLRHADTGWDHYADAWRVVDEQGEVLGTRTLYHPHVDEQPFTRGHGMRIPAATRRVRVEARDKVHGWSPDRLPVDLDRTAGERYEVSR
ncbi:MAG: hypothetical protein R3286_20345 [Gammaproteobacteria bacterium]|nr:hypothetical protein [Gammaproteobacteria bacterium]